MRCPLTRAALLGGLALGLAAAGAASRPAEAAPAGFVDEPYVSGLSLPVAFAFAPDGRLFVTEQGGALRVIKNGELLAEPFASFEVDSGGERGLLGLAFHPDFAVNGKLYAYHTVPGTPPHNRVSVLVADGDVALAGSETSILDLDELSSQRNHNGGSLLFGRDGKLYVGVGENNYRPNAQSLANRLGKILRINDDGSIPDDNPTTFAGIVGSTEGLNRAIWAVGFRNPFSLALSVESSHILVNEVGSSLFEEINVLAAGKNYGWPTVEGFGSNTVLQNPIYAYAQDDGTPVGCAITGGAFYEGAVKPYPTSYHGKYFFADYCGNWIYFVDPVTPGVATAFHTTANAPVGLTVGPDGSLYYLNAGDGSVRRIRYTGQSAQGIVVSGTRLELGEGASATVTVALAQQPPANRVVTISPVLNDATITFAPASITFTPLNWQTARTVTVSAAQDSDRYDEAGTLRFASSGLPTQRVHVTAIDNDRPAGSPRASISRPRNGDTVSGTTAEYFGDAIEGSDYVKAEFYVDAILKYTDRNPSAHYHIGGDHRLWNTRGLSNGTHILTLRVIDAAGRSGGHTIRVNVRN